ncbi:MAG: valine--tRNA ligase [Xanthobacteraceae bacterium]
MLEKTYQPSKIEDRIYGEWERAGAFEVGRSGRNGAEPYCIVIPPPNVTGSLHMGHALNNTLQDVLCRFERMRGKDVLWQPGTDHAGIATQMVVERQLMERQEPDRRTLGREEFIRRVWTWKEESGGTITRQLKRLGASCDWRRERFTMDDGLSRAVIKVFVALHKEGLIYRDKRLVNWDPKLLTAISDLEVQQVETKGSLWYLKYPLEEVPGEFIVVATARPETMLGDVAVAVHPKNGRWKHLIGKHAILPLVGRRIPIIADEYADPEKGSGAVKITPGHDFNDYEVWLRHEDAELKGVQPISIFTPEAKLKSSTFDDYAWGHRGTDPRHPDVTMADEDLVGEETFELIPEELRGLDRFVGRKKIVEMLESKGLIEKLEPTVHTVPHGDRSGVVVEPYLTDQWYVDAKTMAQKPLKAVRGGRTKFVPKNWEKTYFEWLENIKPWCISRQLWWGHQIPAWYGPDGKIFVEQSEAEAYEAARRHYISTGFISENDYEDLKRQPAFADWLKRDEDVLDTWFSSALWPFSTLGWPDATPELKRFYPTSTLVTGFDIIFFWVARMMMMGMHFMKEVPFRNVYIHALVRDEKGAKMSKSKGNVIDPLSIIDDLGADALRFTLAVMAAQGRDIKLSERAVLGYRAFATKLWNAVRLAEIYQCNVPEEFEPRHVGDALNRSIIAKTAKAASKLTKALEEFRFNDAADTIYRLTWDEYCDWYLEFAKAKLTSSNNQIRRETQSTVAWVRDQILKLLHPFMPFVTEELWRTTSKTRIAEAELLTLAKWPSLRHLEGRSEKQTIEFAYQIVRETRSVRVNFGMPANERIVIAPTKLPMANTKILAANTEAIERLSNSQIERGRRQRSNKATGLFVYRVSIPGVAGAELKIVMPRSFDPVEQQRRLRDEIKKIDSEIFRLNEKVSNPDFIRNAPSEVVEEQRARLKEEKTRRAKLRAALASLRRAPNVVRSRSKLRPRKGRGKVKARTSRRHKPTRRKRKLRAASNRKLRGALRLGRAASKIRRRKI